MSFWQTMLPSLIGAFVGAAGGGLATWLVARATWRRDREIAEDARAQARRMESDRAAHLLAERSLDVVGSARSMDANRLAAVPSMLREMVSAARTINRNADLTKDEQLELTAAVLLVQQTFDGFLTESSDLDTLKWACRELTTVALRAGVSQDGVK